MSDADAIDRLPPDARKRLDVLAGAIERIPIDELPLYADRRFDDDHVAAVDRAKAVADEAGLTAGVEGAQRAMAEGVIQMMGASRFRASITGMNMSWSSGTDEDRVRMLESLGDAVTATILADRLDPEDHAELLGLWARLLP